MKRKNICLLVSLILLTSTLCFAQYPSSFTILPKSSKPDFISFLHGVQAWGCDYSYNGKEIDDITPVDFACKYVETEMRKYLNAALPDAFPFEWDRALECTYTSYMNIKVSILARDYYRHNWTKAWRISLSLDFYAMLGYHYYFDIPEFIVDNGDFSDHTLYNTLLSKINNLVIHYRSDKQLFLKRIMTGWKEQNLKKSYKDGLLHPSEGIYEATKAHDAGKLRLGVKQDNGSLYLIYLGGNILSFVSTIWTEGELKGKLETTSLPNVYSVKWINSTKEPRTAYITFESNFMQVKFDNEDEIFSYLKLYPDFPIAITSPSDTWSGTGFALNNGYVVTNYHVIEEAKSITIKGVKGDFNTDLAADVVATDKYNDLALLKITDNRFNGFGTIPYKIKTNTSEVGENVFVLGYPLTSTMGDEIKLTTGVISSKTGFQGDVSLYQISAPVQPGNSGGPLFDNNGNLIGIINAKHGGAENVSYAIKTSYLRNLIESYTSSTILPSNNTLSGLPLTEKVKKAKNFVFMINCSSKNNGNQTNTGVSSITQSQGGNFSNSSATIIRTINNPSVSSTKTESTKIKKVILSKDFTAIEIYFKPSLGQNTYYQHCNIDQNTFIIANDRQYFMTSANNIKTAPDKTYFINDLTFTLYFPPIPENASSIDLIETPSTWKWYGIQLK